MPPSGTTRGMPVSASRACIGRSTARPATAAAALRPGRRTATPATKPTSGEPGSRIISRPAFRRPVQPVTTSGPGRPPLSTIRVFPSRGGTLRSPVRTATRMGSTRERRRIALPATSTITIAPTTPTIAPPDSPWIVFNATGCRSAAGPARISTIVSPSLRGGTPACPVPNATRRATSGSSPVSAATNRRRRTTGTAGSRDTPTAPKPVTPVTPTGTLLRRPGRSFFRA